MLVAARNEWPETAPHAAASNRALCCRPGCRHHERASRSRSRANNSDDRLGGYHHRALNTCSSALFIGMRASVIVAGRRPARSVGRFGTNERLGRVEAQGGNDISLFIAGQEVSRLRQCQLTGCIHQADVSGQ